MLHSTLCVKWLYDILLAIYALLKLYDCMTSKTLVWFLWQLNNGDTEVAKGDTVATTKAESKRKELHHPVKETAAGQSKSKTQNVQQSHADVIAFGGSIGGALLSISLPLTVYAINLACDKVSIAWGSHTPFSFQQVFGDFVIFTSDQSRS